MKSHTSPLQREKGLNHLVVTMAECCCNQSDPCSLWIVAIAIESIEYHIHVCVQWVLTSCVRGKSPVFFPRDHDDQNRTRVFRTERKHFARCSTKYVFVEAWKPGTRLVTSVKCVTRETRIVLYLYPNSVLQKTEYKV